MGRERPSPLKKPSSTSSLNRDVMFFNPALVTPGRTPGLTPSPDSRTTPLPFASRRGPWVVSPPRPKSVEEERTAGFFSSPGTWCTQKLSRRGLCSMALAFLLGAVLFFVALGAYMVLLYLAVTTKKPKYIAFSSLLAGVFFLIACNVLSSGEPTTAVEKERTESEGNDEVLRAYGLQPTHKPV